MSRLNSDFSFTKVNVVSSPVDDDDCSFDTELIDPNQQPDETLVINHKSLAYLVRNLSTIRKEQRRCLQRKIEKRRAVIDADYRKKLVLSLVTRQQEEQYANLLNQSDDLYHTRIQLQNEQDHLLKKILRGDDTNVTQRRLNNKKIERQMNELELIATQIARDETTITCDTLMCTIKLIQ